VGPQGTPCSTYSWDDAGNNTAVNAAGTLTTYSWDGENRLQVIELPTADVMTFTYDATGLRRKRQDTSGTTDFVWDLENLLMEVSGGTQARYTTGLETYGPVLSQRRSGTSHFLLADAIGTTTRLLDASENVTDTYVMDAFGNPVATSGSSVNPFRYVGGLGYYHEPDTSLNYVRARWLRPTTGSWLSVDPVEGEPRHLYVNGSPVNATDGSGRSSGFGMWGEQPPRLPRSWEQVIAEVPAAAKEVFWDEPAEQWVPGDSIWSPGSGYGDCVKRCMEALGTGTVIGIGGGAGGAGIGLIATDPYSGLILRYPSVEAVKAVFLTDSVGAVIGSGSGIIGTVGWIGIAIAVSAVGWAGGSTLGCHAACYGNQQAW
jgi:RHS repeat-associated protein